MKNFIKILITITSISMLFSCTGEDGIDGRNGSDAAQATIFETDPINFASTDGLTAIKSITIDERIEIFQSDIALVYILDPIETAANNGLNVWEPLPSTFFFDDGGHAQYRFNFVFDDRDQVFDIEITLESTDFNKLEPEFTNNQIFRIAVIPASNINNFSAQASNLVQSVDDSKIIKLN